MRSRASLASLLVLGTLSSLSAQKTYPMEVTKLSASRKPTLKGAESYSQGGLELEIKVLLENLHIIGLAKEKCVLRTWSDDKGTDLKAGARKGVFHWVKLGTRFDSDKSAVWTLDLSTETLPSKAAGRLELDADVVLISAVGERSVKSKVKLEKGAEIPKAPFALSIGSAKKSNFGNGWSVSLQAKEPMDAIKDVRFYDAQGKRIAHKNDGSGSMSFGGATTYSRSFRLPKQIDSATVELILYENIKQVVVPLKLELGLGL